MLLDICEESGFDLGEGVKRARAVATLMIISGEKMRSGYVTLLESQVPEEWQSTEVWLP